jgi:hypothetical protein
MKAKARIEVRSATNEVLGVCFKSVSSGLWRATGKSPTVFVNRQRQAKVLGKGADAKLVVWLEPGEAPPKQLEPIKEAA